MPRVCNGCLAASVDAVYGTVPAADTIHDPATCELVPPIAPTLPVTTITIRWQGDPAAIDAALAYVRAVVACAEVYMIAERAHRQDARVEAGAGDARGVVGAGVFVGDVVVGLCGHGGVLFSAAVFSAGVAGGVCVDRDAGA